MPEGLTIGLILAVIGQTVGLGLLWRAIGRLETAVKRSCPFGECPLYHRAKEEAVESRIVSEKHDEDKI